MKVLRSDVQNKQAGLASILVTIIMMLVITLIVLGFAQIARREQQETLDAQLSAQAFYAAESGVNDAIALYNSNGQSLPNKTTCTGGPGVWSTNFTNFVANGANNTELTCLTYNSQPPNLQYTNLNVGQSQVVNLQSSSSFSGIAISWNGTSSNNYSSCPAVAPTVQFPKSWPANCGAGVLEVEIVPTTLPSNALDLSPTDDLVLYLVPLSSVSGPTTATTPAAGSTIPVDCSTSHPSPGSLYPYDCNLYLTMPVATTEYYVRFIPVYLNADISLDGASSVSSPATLINGQVSIDATGRSQYVIRRVEERLPSASNGNFQPSLNGALQSTNSICKQFIYSTSTGTATGPGADSNCQ